MTEESFLALSGIQHIAFCPRQWALIHIEKQWLESFHTAHGRVLHERTHDPFLLDNRSGVLIAHAVPLRSESLGIFGEADTVEFTPASDGIELPKHKGCYRVAPIEYKRGKPKTEEWDHVQVCAQALCLEEMLETDITEGALFYWETRRREPVEMTTKLRNYTKELIEEMHRLYANGETPPAKKTRLCRSCSLQQICLPSLAKSKSVEQYLAQTLREEG